MLEQKEIPSIPAMNPIGYITKKVQTITHKKSISSKLTDKRLKIIKQN